MVTSLGAASTVHGLGARTETMDIPKLIQNARDVLLQGLGLLFELDDRTYSRSASAPFHAAIGEHYRRVLERFQSLVHGLRAREINYDAFEERNSRLQQEVRYASVATCHVLRALKPFTEETRMSGNEQLRVWRLETSAGAIHHPS